MSIEKRLLRGDNIEDVRKLFPNNGIEIDKILSSMKKKKPVKKTKG